MRESGPVYCPGPRAETASLSLLNPSAIETNMHDFSYGYAPLHARYFTHRKYHDEVFPFNLLQSFQRLGIDVLVKITIFKQPVHKGVKNEHL